MFCVLLQCLTIMLNSNDKESLKDQHKNKHVPFFAVKQHCRMFQIM